VNKVENVNKNDDTIDNGVEDDKNPNMKWMKCKKNHYLRPVLSKKKSEWFLGTILWREVKLYLKNAFVTE
jgi:hypothetical protein